MKLQMKAILMFAALILSSSAFAKVNEILVCEFDNSAYMMRFDGAQPLLARSKKFTLKQKANLPKLTKVKFTGTITDKKIDVSSLEPVLLTNSSNPEDSYYAYATVRLSTIGKRGRVQLKFSVPAPNGYTYEMPIQEDTGRCAIAD